MFLTIHTLTGALLARSSSRGSGALLALGVASHLALDAVPHFGAPGVTLRTTSGRAVATIDCAVSLATWSALATTGRGERRRTTMAVLGAALPDLLYIPQQLVGWDRPRWFFAVHKRVQWSETPVGGLVEAAFAIGLTRALRRRRRPA